MTEVVEIPDAAVIAMNAVQQLVAVAVVLQVTFQKSLTISICGLIDSTCENPDSYEEGEPRTPPEVIERLKAILREATTITGEAVPPGDVYPYFGELSVTWRNGTKMLRLTSFSDRESSRLDFGSSSCGALANYEFDPQANGKALSEKLSLLTGFVQSHNS